MAEIQTIKVLGEIDRGTGHGKLVVSLEQNSTGEVVVAIRHFYRQDGSDEYRPSKTGSVSSEAN